MHDSGFVCGMRLIGHPLLLWIEDTFSVGAPELADVALFGGDIRLGSLALGKGPEQT